jgi:hypothetical protein
MTVEEAEHEERAAPTDRGEPPLAAPELPISRTLRIRGTRQNVRTDHLRQNVGRRAVVI